MLSICSTITECFKERETFFHFLFFLLDKQKQTALVLVYGWRPLWVLFSINFTFMGGKRRHGITSTTPALIFYLVTDGSQFELDLAAPDSYRLLAGSYSSCRSTNSEASTFCSCCYCSIAFCNSVNPLILNFYISCVRFEYIF